MCKKSNDKLKQFCASDFGKSPHKTLLLFAIQLRDTFLLLNNKPFLMSQSKTSLIP